MKTETIQFRDFDKQDFCAFGGVESSDPQIAFFGEDAIVLDDDVLEVVSTSGQSYRADYASLRLAKLAGEDLLRSLNQGEPLEVAMLGLHLEAIN